MMLKIYKFNNLPFIKLNEIQKKYRDIFLNKIKKNIYSLVANPCYCGINSDLLISETCRFGFNTRFVQCCNCGLIRQDPVLDKYSMNSFYENEYRPLYTGKIAEYNIGEIFCAQYKSGKEYFNFIDKFLSSRNLSIKDFNQVLEIGSSAGGILAYFQDRGHIVYGVDPDEVYVKYANKRGCKSDSIFFNNILKKKFDIIILSHTFEHMLSPIEKLNSIYNLLNNNGIVFMQLPGILSKNLHRMANIFFDYKKLHFMFYLQNAHTLYFTKKTFINLINFSGWFEIGSINEDISTVLVKKNSIKINKFIIKSDNKINNFIFKNNLRYFILKGIWLLLKWIPLLIKKLKKTT